MSEQVDQAEPNVVTESSLVSIDGVTLSHAQLEAFRAVVSCLSNQQAGTTRLVGIEEKALESPALVHEITWRDRRIAELETSCKSAIREREVANALAGRPLANGAAAQLVRLWRDEFDVFEDAGSYRVAARDGRSVAETVGEWLASTDYAHFCLPTSRGGSGARDANRPASPATSVASPKNLGEAVVMKWREESAARSESLLKPVGLRRQR